MKKLFTLLFTVGCVTSVFAQYNNDYKNDWSGRVQNNNGSYSKPAERQEAFDRNNEKRDYAYNDHRYNESFSMNSGERDFQIQKVNRKYDFKINSIRTSRYLRSYEKSWQIRKLENQRSDEISNLLARYHDSRNRYDDGHPNRW